MGKLRPVLRGLPIIILTMIGGIMLAKKYLKYTTPMYESTTKIKLADKHEGVSNSNLYKDFDVFTLSNKIGAEVELLKSKMLVTKAISSLPFEVSIFRVGNINKKELYMQSPFSVSVEITDKKAYNKPFSVKISRDSIVELKTPGGEVINTKLNHVINAKSCILALIRNDKFLSERPDLAINDTYEFIVHSEERLIDGIIKDLDIMAVDKDIPVLRISYKSAVPEKSADMVNALSKAYIKDYIEEKFRSADTTSVFLNNQLSKYSTKLSASEGAIESYRNRNNIINIRQETETDLRKISDLKKQLASVQMNLNAIDSLNVYINEGRNRFLELAPNFEAFTDLLSTEMVKKAKELQREKRDLLTRFTAEDEKVKVIDEKLKDIADYMVESIKNTEKNLSIKYKDLTNTIAESEKVFVGLPSREKEMTIMERNFGLNEQIFRFLHEKRAEAEIAKAATISFHRIIAEGEIPSVPVSPNYTILTIMGGILGLFGGVGIVYLIHSIRSRVNDAQNIYTQSSTPLAAAVPFFGKKRQESSFFRRFALELEIKGFLKKGNVISLSSFKSNEGKTYNANALHKAIESIGKKSVVVNIEDVIDGSTDKLEKWKEFINKVREEYDVVLIRNYSIDLQGMSLVIMAASDLNLVVLDSLRTKKHSVVDADLLKEELQLKEMQFILNRAGYIPNTFTHIRNIYQWCINIFRK
jgi:uncharacterized protein involved in exopolysaccharide biosynthesis